MNFHVVRTSQASSLSARFFFPIRFAPSLFLPSIFISHDREKDTDTDRRKHHRLENHGTSHTSFRPWYRDAEENLWGLFATGSLPMKNIDTFFCYAFLFCTSGKTVPSLSRCVSKVFLQRLTGLLIRTLYARKNCELLLSPSEKDKVYLQTGRNFSYIFFPNINRFWKKNRNTQTL